MSKQDERSINDLLGGMLNDPNKKAHEVNCLLNTVFRMLLKDRQITLAKWLSLMDRFVSDPTRFPQTSASRSSARGNLKKDLTRDKMTMDVFQKALAFLNPKSATMTLEMEWFDGTKTTIPCTLYLSKDITEYVDNSTGIKIPQFVTEEDFLRQLENAKKIYNKINNLEDEDDEEAD